MISCGEASGDVYAGALVHALREIEPSIDVFGFGGQQLAAAKRRADDLEALGYVEPDVLGRIALGVGPGKIEIDVEGGVDVPALTVQIMNDQRRRPRPAASGETANDVPPWRGRLSPACRIPRRSIGMLGKAQR